VIQQGKIEAFDNRLSIQVYSSGMSLSESAHKLD